MRGGLRRRCGARPAAAARRCSRPDPSALGRELGSATGADGERLSLSFDTITEQGALDGLAAGWDDLVLALPRPTPFLLHGWLVEWWRHYGEGARLAVHLARRDGRLVGALPLYTERARGLRITRFLGGHSSALGDLLLARGEGEEVARGLAARAAAMPHDVADLFGLPAESRLAATLGPRRLRLIERVEAPVLDLTGGWEAVYRAKTDSRKRNLHKRRRRQLAEQGELEVVRARRPEELEPALEDAFRLHELRWSGRPDGSGFATDVGRRFNRAALRRLADLDVARIVVLRVGGRAIAFHYFFAFAGRMYVYRLAFDPEFGRFSPGLVNTLDALEWAGDEGLGAVEYLGGDERYKLELSDRLEPLYQGLGLARTPQGRALLGLRLGSIRARRRLKRSPVLHRLYFETLAPVRRLARRVSRPSRRADPGSPDERPPHA